MTRVILPATACDLKKINDFLYCQKYAKLRLNLSRNLPRSFQRNV